MKNMAEILKAESRESTKSSVNRLRKEGFFPAVLYGDEIDNQPVAIEEKAFEKVYRQVGRSGVFSLEIKDEKHPVMVYDLQIDPIKNNVVHADFFRVNMNVEVDAEIPVQLTGSAPGEKEGGIVSHMLYVLNVRALPADLPSNIEISLDDLNIGDSVLVSDLKESANYTIMNADEEAIVSVLAPSEEEPEETEATEEDEVSDEAEETEEESAGEEE